MPDSNNARTWPCPSPDDCPFTAGGAAELAEHVNTEHSGEYRRDDWPDTPSGRASRSGETADDDDNDGDDPDDDADVAA